MAIAKLFQNPSANRTLKYVVSKPGAEIIGGNTAPWLDLKNLAREQLNQVIKQATQRYDVALGLNRKIKRPIYHASLSLKPGENLNDEQLGTLADQYLAGLILSAEHPELLKNLDESLLQQHFQKRVAYFCQEELSKYPYIVVRHRDTNHPHVHLVWSKINLETQTAIPTSHDRYRSQKVLRILERQYGLEVQPSSWEVHRKSESTQQIQAEIKTGKPSVHKQLQHLLDQAATQCKTVPEWVEKLQEEGVEVRVQFTRTGKSKGISYGLDGVALAGHALGTRYSFSHSEPGLVKYLGLSYDPECDRELIQALCRRPIISRSISTPDSTPPSAPTIPSSPISAVHPAIPAEPEPNANFGPNSGSNSSLNSSSKVEQNPESGGKKVREQEPQIPEVSTPAPPASIPPPSTPPPSPVPASPPTQTSSQKSSQNYYYRADLKTQRGQKLQEVLLIFERVTRGQNQLRVEGKLYWAEWHPDRSVLVVGHQGSKSLLILAKLDFDNKRKKILHRKLEDTDWQNFDRLIEAQRKAQQQAQPRHPNPGSNQSQRRQADGRQPGDKDQGR